MNELEIIERIVVILIGAWSGCCIWAAILVHRWEQRLRKRAVREEKRTYWNSRYDYRSHHHHPHNARDTRKA